MNFFFVDFVYNIICNSYKCIIVILTFKFHTGYFWAQQLTTKVDYGNRSSGAYDHYHNVLGTFSMHNVTTGCSNNPLPRHLSYVIYNNKLFNLTTLSQNARLEFISHIPSTSVRSLFIHLSFVVVTFIKTLRTCLKCWANTIRGYMSAQYCMLKWCKSKVYNKKISNSNSLKLRKDDPCTLHGITLLLGCWHISRPGSRPNINKPIPVTTKK